MDAPAVLVIPHRNLSEGALRAVIEDFITREGTDYGQREYTPEQKYDDVAKKLEAGEAFIVFDGESENVSLMRREDLPPDALP